MRINKHNSDEQITKNSDINYRDKAWLKVPYSSKKRYFIIQKKGLVNWYMVLVQSYNVASDSL